MVIHKLFIHTLIIVLTIMLYYITRWVVNIAHVLAIDNQALHKGYGFPQQYL